MSSKSSKPEDRAPADQHSHGARGAHIRADADHDDIEMKGQTHVFRRPTT
jgi:hypothetical protein